MLRKEQEIEIIEKRIGKMKDWEKTKSASKREESKRRKIEQIKKQKVEANNEKER